MAGSRESQVSGYNKPKVLGVAALRRSPFEAHVGYSEGVLLIERAGSKALRQCIVQCTVHAA